MGSSGKVQVPMDEQAVEACLARLRYALSQESTEIILQKTRYADQGRQAQYTNTYTLGRLFPDESPKESLRRELACLEVAEYMEAVKDIKYPKRSDLWVFGKSYEEGDVYIKFRVEIVERTYVYVLSFHFATIPFCARDFPLAK